MSEDIYHNLSIQVGKIEKDFEQTISRLKDVDEYIGSRLRRAKKIVKLMPNTPEKLYIVIDILGEINRIIEKMEEVEGMFAPFHAVPLEEVEENLYYE